MHKDLITIVTVESKAKAELFQMILEKHGISVFLSPNDKIKVLGDATISRQPFDVMVGRNDVEEALNIIQSRKTQEIPASDEEFDLFVVICPKCKKRILIKKAFMQTLQQCPKCFEAL